MDAPILRRAHPRSPAPLRRACIGAAALLLCAAGFAGAQAPRFGVHASARPMAAAPAGGGFELRARLTPATHALQGAGYRVDAVAVPAASCNGDDRIFANGFELPFMR